MKKNIFLILLSILSFSAQAQPPIYQVSICKPASTGYYFLCNTESLMILDNAGTLIYYKRGNNFSNFMIQPNGIMTYAEFNGFMFMDSTFSVFDSIKCKNVALTNYHDLRILPIGHFLLMGTDSVMMNLSGNTFWQAKGLGDTANVKYAVVQEQDANRKVVFEWRAKDYYAFDDADTFDMTSHSLLLDWTHPDAVEADADGNILLSNRNFNEITKINRTTGAIIWRFGGKQNQFRFINCPVPFYRQHDIRRIANGHITLFDNGDHNTPHGARALEFELDEINKTAKLKWSYTFDSTMHSTRQGNVQRLANSNTLINYGNTAGNANSQISFLVVNPKGEIIFELEGLHSYRAFNYPVLPWQLHRPQITCIDSAGVTYLDAGTGYASYRWSNGDSTQIIPVTLDGSYSVFVPYGEGGFISSEKLVVHELLGCSGNLNPVKKKKQVQNKKQ